MTASRVERIGGSFAGKVTGLEIAAGVDAAGIAAAEGFLADFPVLCFPAQDLSDTAQTAFVHAFGHGFDSPEAKIARNADPNPKLLDVTNVDADDRAFPTGSARARFYDANLLWHTDGSYSEVPFRVTGLSARLLPSDPPDTEFADMRAAWDALRPAMQARCESLRVEHSLAYSRGRMGLGAEEVADYAPDGFTRGVLQPLVRTHARSRRRSLYLSAHAGRIAGWPDKEGEAFLDELIAFATQARFVYTHKWQAQDFLMWDDSCTMHRATPYDGTEPRMLRWTAAYEPTALAT